MRKMRHVLELETKYSEKDLVWPAAAQPCVLQMDWDGFKFPSDHSAQSEAEYTQNDFFLRNEATNKYGINDVI